MVSATLTCGFFRNSPFFSASAIASAASEVVRPSTFTLADQRHGIVPSSVTRASVVISGCWNTVTCTVSPTPELVGCFALRLPTAGTASALNRNAINMRIIVTSFTGLVQGYLLNWATYSIRAPSRSFFTSAAAISRRLRPARNCSMSAWACSARAERPRLGSAGSPTPRAGVGKTAVSPAFMRASFGRKASGSSSAGCVCVVRLKRAPRARERAATIWSQCRRLARWSTGRRGHDELAHAVDAPLGEERRVLVVEGAHFVAARLAAPALSACALDVGLREHLAARVVDRLGDRRVLVEARPRAPSARGARGR